MQGNIRHIKKSQESPTIKVEVIDIAGKIVESFLAQPGFSLLEYVRNLYPKNELMVYFTPGEVNVSVLEDDRLTRVYRGRYL